MTLVFGLKWLFEEGDAVLIVSDTRATTPYGIVFEARKIHAVTLGEDKYLGVVGGAGDPALVKWGFEVVDDVLKKHAGDDGLIFFNNIRNAVREIEEMLVARLGGLRKEGLDPSLQLILGSVDLDGRASLYQFDGRGGWLSRSTTTHDTPS
jgi:20S proteasome alpha/beta subunit